MDFFRPCLSSCKGSGGARQIARAPPPLGFQDDIQKIAAVEGEQFILKLNTDRQDP